MATQADPKERCDLRLDQLRQASKLAWQAMRDLGEARELGTAPWEEYGRTPPWDDIRRFAEQVDDRLRAAEKEAERRWRGQFEMADD